MQSLMTRLFVAVQSQARNGFRREEGQALVEYALILALVSIVAILFLKALGVQVKSAFSYIKDTIDTAVPG